MQLGERDRAPRLVRGLACGQRHLAMREQQHVRLRQRMCRLSVQACTMLRGNHCALPQPVAPFTHCHLSLSLLMTLGHALALLAICTITRSTTSVRIGSQHKAQTTLSQHSHFSHKYSSYNSLCEFAMLCDTNALQRRSMLRYDKK
jgi:hypothetical protein